MKTVQSPVTIPLFVTIFAISAVTSLRQRPRVVTSISFWCRSTTPLCDMLAFVKSVEGEKTMGKREIPSPPQVKIRGIPDAHNDWLTDYFSATFARTRLYWLLASLSRHQSIRTAN